MSVQFFLTSWDPSDLPGSSVDPLGFDRAYGALADLWLPGLTNVASRPRYFAILCLGAQLADTSGVVSPRDERAARVEAVLRLEKLWCLAHALADDAEGIRGVRYAQAHAGRLREKGASETTLDFPVLSSQARYGAVGIYSSVGEGLRLLDGSTLRPTADLGARLGAAFRKHTKIPGSIVDAVRGDATRVPLKALTDWIERAHISGEPLDDEASCYREALTLHPLRARVVRALGDTPARDGEPELLHLARVRQRLLSTERDLDLADALEALLALEDGYRVLHLVFDRLLWLCANAPAGGVAVDDAAGDVVIAEAAGVVRTARDRFARALDQPATGHLSAARARLDDVRALLGQAADAATPGAVVDVVFARHAAVQAGKVHRGQRKAPFIERRDGSWTLCLGRAAENARDVQTLNDIRPHEYRVRAATRLAQAGGAA